ncbi:hypothetical protein QBC34DRAFT_404123, partial [Podospora aff. communis PSN243]
KTAVYRRLLPAEDEADASHLKSKDPKSDSELETVVSATIPSMTSSLQPGSVILEATTKPPKQEINGVKKPESSSIPDDKSSSRNSADGSLEGDYFSDYTPDFPYMDDEHPFMRQKSRALEALLERFWGRLRLKGCVGGHDTAGGGESLLAAAREQVMDTSVIMDGSTSSVVGTAMSTTERTLVEALEMLPPKPRTSGRRGGW